MIGKTISHYKILEKLGEGGMGVVYKAEDTKLKRDVALKFLPTNALQGKAEKERFTREAQAAASLNHANIAHIYAIEELDDQIFIAMEFIEGQSLSDMVTSPLPFDDAINYTNQIASGLRAAHKKGITHRDIKSANIMITEEGQVKIMDFGLAKLANRSMMTQAGTTLGTAAYMSPEQSRGEKVDHRSDIWSLGAILYEMISGQLPFKGEYESAVIYSIQNEEPEPMTALRSNVPVALDGMIAKALAKDVDMRYQNVEELPADLKALETAPSRVSRKTTTATAEVEQPILSTRWPPMVPWVLVFVLAIFSVLALWGPWRKPEPASQSVRRFTIDLPSGEWLGTEYMESTNVALSPDGTRLVYVGVRDGISQLYLRQFDQFEAQTIPQTEGSRDPFFSLDGEWVAFFTSRKLKKVSLSSGTVVALCDVLPVSSGGGWGSDNTIYFNQAPVGGLVRVSAGGGTPEPVTTPDSTQGELGHFHPVVLPGGNAILFTIAKSERNHDTVPAVLSLETGAWYRLTERGTRPHYLSTGYLVYVQAGALLAATFDLDRLRITGSPVRILEGVMTGSQGAASFSVSANGSIAYVPDRGTESANTLLWADREGETRPLLLPPRSYSNPRLSPDGTGLVIEIMDSQTGNVDVWLGGLAPPLTRFTFNANYDGRAIWTTDGKRVIFSSVRMGQAPNLLWKPEDGSVVEEPLSMMENEQLNTVGNAQFATSLSPDGRVLAIVDENSETGLDIWLVNMKGQRKPQP